MAANLPSTLNFTQYRDLVKKLKHGKSLPTAIYLHKSSLAEALPAELLSFITNTINKLEVKQPWNLIKLYKRRVTSMKIHTHCVRRIATALLNNRLISAPSRQNSQI